MLRQGPLTQEVLIATALAKCGRADIILCILACLCDKADDPKVVARVKEIGSMLGSSTDDDLKTAVSMVCCSAQNGSSDGGGGSGGGSQGGGGSNPDGGQGGDDQQEEPDDSDDDGGPSTAGTVTDECVATLLEATCSDEGKAALEWFASMNDWLTGPLMDKILGADDAMGKATALLAACESDDDDVRRAAANGMCLLWAMILVIFKSWGGMIKTVTPAATWAVVVIGFARIYIAVKKCCRAGGNLIPGPIVMPDGGIIDEQGEHKAFAAATGLPDPMAQAPQAAQGQPARQIELPISQLPVQQQQQQQPQGQGPVPAGQATGEVGSAIGGVIGAAAGTAACGPACGVIGGVLGGLAGGWAEGQIRGLSLSLAVAQPQQLMQIRDVAASSHLPADRAVGATADFLLKSKGFRTLSVKDGPAMQRALLATTARRLSARKQQRSARKGKRIVSKYDVAAKHNPQHIACECGK